MKPYLRMTIVLTMVMALAGLVHGAAMTAGQQVQGQEDYVIGRADVLNITVFEQPEFTGKYGVDQDGTIRFSLAGRVKAAGLTLRQLESDLKKLLADGWVKNPQLTVNLDSFRGQRVFVFGGVSSPGTYPLTDGATIVEVLVKAGYGAASEAVIVRSRGGAANGPVMPENAGNADVIRVNLRELEKDVENGRMSRNVLLRDGDTVFVPRVDRNRVFVTGQVKTPGAYSVPEGTTVLQAISLAGGFTEGASTGRIRILRIVKDQQKSIKAKLEDKLLPGDTIVVPERFF